MKVKKLSPVSYQMICLGMILLMTLAGCTRDPEKLNDERRLKWNFATETTLLATIDEGEKPLPSIPGHGAEPVPENRPALFQVIFSESGTGVAYLTETNGRANVVYNGTRGPEYDAVDTVVISPDGRRIAYTARTGNTWRMVIDGHEGRPYDTVLTPIFSPNGKHVAYQAKERDKWYVSVDDMRNAGTIASYTTPEFNSGSTLIAYVEAAASSSDMKLIVSDLTFRKQNIKKSIGDLLFITNRDKTRIAAEQVVDNKVRIISFSFDMPDDIHEGKLYDLIEPVALSDDGSSVAYCALRGKERLTILDDREETLPPGRLPEVPVIRPDKKGVGFLLVLNDKVFLHQAFFNSQAKEKMYDEATSLTYSPDSSLHAYAARKGNNWFIVVNGKEGPAFERVVNPLFSPDSKHLVYRARENGKRFVIVADTDGKTINRHPTYEQVFQPVFVKDGTAIAYGVKDGNKLIWTVEKLN